MVKKAVKGYKKMVIFSYSTEHLLKKDKIRFYYALKGRDGKSGVAKTYNINHLGRAVILIHKKFEKEVLEFLDFWKCKYKKLEVLIK